MTTQVVRDTFFRMINRCYKRDVMHRDQNHTTLETYHQHLCSSSQFLQN